MEADLQDNEDHVVLDEASPLADPSLAYYAGLGTTEVHPTPVYVAEEDPVYFRIALVARHALPLV